LFIRDTSPIKRIIKENEPYSVSLLEPAKTMKKIIVEITMKEEIFKKSIFFAILYFFRIPFHYESF